MQRGFASFWFANSGRFFATICQVDRNILNRWFHLEKGADCTFSAPIEWTKELCSSEIQTLQLLILLSLDQVRFVQISIEIVAGEILETLVSSSLDFERA